MLALTALLRCRVILACIPPSFLVELVAFGSKMLALTALARWYLSMSGNSGMYTSLISSRTSGIWVKDASADGAGTLVPLDVG